jgi:hypothetical protein
MSSGHPTAVQGNGNLYTAMGRLEWVIKVAALAVGVVTVLGFPAVFVQFRAFSVPALFLPKDQALRAGVAPALVLLALSGFVYTGFKSSPAGEPRFLRILVKYAFLFAVVTAVFLVVSLIARHFQLLGNSATDHSVKQTSISLVSGVLSFVANKWKALESKISWLETRDLTKNWIVVPAMSAGAAFAITTFAPLFFVKGSIEGAQYLHRLKVGGLAGVLVLLIAFAVSGRAQVRSTDRKISWRGKVVLFLATVSLYAVAVGSYSFRIYEMLPYSFGGGKPTAVRLLIEKSAFEPSIMASFRDARQGGDAEGLLLRGYMLYWSSDEVVLSSSDRQPASSVVLNRHSVLAITAVGNAP